MRLRFRRKQQPRFWWVAAYWSDDQQDPKIALRRGTRQEIIDSARYDLADDPTLAIWLATDDYIVVRPTDT